MRTSWNPDCVSCRRKASGVNARGEAFIAVTSPLVRPPPRCPRSGSAVTAAVGALAPDAAGGGAVIVDVPGPDRDASGCADVEAEPDGGDGTCTVAPGMSAAPPPD